MSVFDIFGVADKALALFNKLADAFRDKKLRDEGASEQKLTDTQGVLANVEKANAAVDDPDLDKRVSDKYGR